jgi:hypothetical protein
MGNMRCQLAQAIEEPSSRVGEPCGDDGKLGEVAVEPDVAGDELTTWRARRGAVTEGKQRWWRGQSVALSGRWVDKVAGSRADLVDMDARPDDGRSGRSVVRALLAEAGGIDTEVKLGSQILSPRGQRLEVRHYRKMLNL